MINVTVTYLPPIEEYIKYIKEIWENNRVTNNGPMVQRLECLLKRYLGVKHLIAVNNGTTALQIAIKALNIKKEIITTPFSFVATSSSIEWMGLRPVFADIEETSLNINPESIIKSITADTEAIMPTHIFGNPCDVEAIEYIAKKYGLRVIYDGAHTFGVRYKNVSILNYGDISAISFHATKLFHCIEGGAIVTNDDELAARIESMRSFGYNPGSDHIEGPGINAKMSELHAANGLCLLPKIYEIIQSRKTISDLYDKLLIHPASKLNRPVIRSQTRYNYSYYPVIFPNESSMFRVIDSLEKHNIFPRRYFSPSLNKLGYLGIHKRKPVSESIAKRVLCLPLYPTLSLKQAYEISSIINSELNELQEVTEKYEISIF